MRLLSPDAHSEGYTGLEKMLRTGLPVECWMHRKIRSTMSTRVWERDGCQDVPWMSSPVPSAFLALS